MGLEENCERGKDLGMRITMLLTKLCKVQKLECITPIPVLAEFVVGFLKEKEKHKS